MQIEGNVSLPFINFNAYQKQMDWEHALSQSISSFSYFFFRPSNYAVLFFLHVVFKMPQLQFKSSKSIAIFIIKGA